MKLTWVLCLKDTAIPLADDVNMNFKESTSNIIAGKVVSYDNVDFVIRDIIIDGNEVSVFIEQLDNKLRR